jgi:uncharacterized membrane protein YuzA (DUF378 family)
MKRNAVLWVSWVLVVIGGLNWGLVGIFKYNLVTSIFGVNSAAARIVFALVGVAALVEIIGLIVMASKKDTASATRS